MRRSLWLAALLLTIAAGRAEASSRVLGQFPGSLLSDGRYLAASDAANRTLRIFDAANGHRRSVASPAGCFPADLARGRVLFNCPVEVGPGTTLATGQTFDLATGLTATLPALTRSTFGPDGEGQTSVRYVSVGTRWAEVELSGYHYRVSRYFRLDSGALGEGPGADRSRVADLDAEGASRSLCSPMQRPLGPDGFIDLAPAPLLVVGRRAAAVHLTHSTSDAKLRLQQCGRPPRTISNCYATCGEVVLDDRTLAWTEGSGTGSIVVYRRDLRTGRTRSLPRATPTQLRLVRHRLYTRTDGELRVLTP